MLETDDFSSPPRADGVQRLTLFPSLLAGALEKKKPEGGRPVSLRLRASEALSSTLTLINISMCLKHLLIHTRLQVGHSHQHVFDLLTPSALSYLSVFFFNISSTLACNRGRDRTT